MPQLTKSEIDQLLAMPIIARLATVKPDGTPYIAPVWEYWDGESMFIIPRGKSKFVEYIKANPRVAISCADDIKADHSRVLLEGTIEIVEGPVRMEGFGLEIGRAGATLTLGAPRVALALRARRWVGHEERLFGL